MLGVSLLRAGDIMAWNVVNIVEHGANSDGMYPVPTGKGVGIDRIDGDGESLSYDIAQLAIYRSIDSKWTDVYLSRGNPGTMLITGKRVALVFKSVPVKRSFFTPVAVIQSVAQAGQHRGESLVGQILYSEIHTVSARNFAPGVSSLPALRLGATDGTVNPSAGVIAEITFTGRTKASRIGDELLARMVDYRLRDPVFAEHAADHAAWHKLRSSPFAPPRRDFESRSFGVHRMVGRGNYRSRAQQGLDFE
jgi:hypothetical protein